MDMEVKPPCNSSSSSSSEPTKSVEEERRLVNEVEGLEAPPMKLGLGSVSSLVKNGKASLAFTPPQLCELQRQIMVLSYLCAGLSVPPGLLLPGGQSFYSPKIVGMGLPGFDCGMEPGRCRRTDGKKWRCRKDALPNQKYCQAHMHRGRNRSRKLVEASVSHQTANPSQTQPHSPRSLEDSSTKKCKLTSVSTSSVWVDDNITLQGPSISSANVGLRVACNSVTATFRVPFAASCDVSGPKEATVIEDIENVTRDTEIATSTTVADLNKTTKIEDFEVIPVITTTVPRVIDCHKDITTFQDIKVEPSSMAVMSSNAAGLHKTIALGNLEINANAKTASSCNATDCKITTEMLDVATTISDIAAISYAVSSAKTTTVANCKSGSIDRRCHGRVDGHGNCCNALGHKNETNRRSDTKDINKLTATTSRGLDFSPKSVLQARGCTPSYICDPELEPGRCRRTDGRKWRCRKDVIPNQKYCAMHMHRGAKKRVEASQAAVLPSAKRATSTHPHFNPSCPYKGDRGLNTKLSISLPESCLLMENDDLSTTSGSSDATISDTI